MAKRYHQSAKMVEVKAMMAGDRSMITDDMSAPSCLPREVMDKYWPKGPDYNLGRVDDLFNGVQKQMGQDYKDLKKVAKPGKY